jgi:hypothetical protein
VLEDDRLSSEPVELGCRCARVSTRTRVIRTQGVDRNQDEIPGLLLTTGDYECRREQEDQPPGSVDTIASASNHRSQQYRGSRWVHRSTGLPGSPLISRILLKGTAASFFLMFVILKSAYGEECMDCEYVGHSLSLYGEVVVVPLNADGVTRCAAPRGLLAPMTSPALHDTNHDQPAGASRE